MKNKGNVSSRILAKMGPKKEALKKIALPIIHASAKVRDLCLAPPGARQGSMPPAALWEPGRGL